MDSIFTVVTPASDRTLSSIPEMRLAVGLGADDGSKDATLKALGDRVADRIVQACRVATDGATPPTLRQEAVTDTFRRQMLHWRGDWRSQSHDLILSRRHVVTIVSVTENDTTLDATDYEIVAGAGLLRRLMNDQPCRWWGTKIIVSYTAGFATVPSGLKLAAEQLLRNYWYQNTRDPTVRQINVPGVVERTYFQGGTTGDPDIPQDVMDMLRPYMNVVIG